MPTINFDLLKQWFDQLVELSDSERVKFLREAQGIDEDTRRQLLQLLSADAQLIGQTARPAINVARGKMQDATMIGQRIGAYVVDQSLGSGGMGSVFLAHRADGSIEQQVAIKIVRPEMLDQHTLARFHLERQVLALLKHPHIATLLDAGELEDGSPYVVMEYIEGEPVTAFVSVKQLDLRQRLQLFLKICDAVAFAHRNLIVHRDLKSGNVLVTSDGQPKLLDFGIAKPLVGMIGTIDVQDTAAAQRFFSPHNAAPEQLRNEPITPACDVYGLGVLLYELLTGNKPLDLQGLTPGEMEQKVLNEDPKPPSQRPSPTAVVGAASGRECPTDAEVASERHPSTPNAEQSRPEAAPTPASTTALIPRRALKGDLDAITLKCLRKNPNDRYATVDQIANDIRAHLDGYAVAARRGGRWYRLRRFVGRHRLAVAASAVVVVVASIGALTWLRQYRATLDQQSRADQMTSLIMGAIDAADPSGGNAKDMKVRDLFDRIATNIVADPNKSSTRQIGLLVSLSEVQRRLELSDKALEILDGIEIASLAEADAESVLRARAKALILLARYSEAEALVPRGRSLAADVEIGTEWALISAQLDFDQGNADPAIATIEAVDIEALSFTLRSAARQLLARCYVSKGMIDHARQELSALLADQQRELGEDSSYLLQTYTSFFDLSRQEARWDEAAEYARKRLELSDRLYSRDSMPYAKALMMSATSLVLSGKAEQAIEAHLEALALYSSHLGDSHPDLAKVHFNLSGMYNELNNPDKVLFHLEKAVAVAERAWSPTHANLLLFRIIYASQLIKAGDFERAGVVAQTAKRDAAQSVELQSNPFFVVADLIEAMAGFSQDPSTVHRDAVVARYKALVQTDKGQAAMRVTDELSHSIAGLGIALE
jgi:serine/threonine protein kinase/tetratricopeptide (TPR) repeat protein